MRLPYGFHPEARAELNDAAEHYREAYPETATAFAEEIAQAIDFIVTYPQGSPVVTLDVRQKTVRRFPYVLLYWVGHDAIHILAVMHQHRRPFYWLGRDRDLQDP